MPNAMPETSFLLHFGGPDNLKRVACERILNQITPFALEPFRARGVDKSHRIETPIKELVEAVRYGRVGECEWQS